MANIQLTQCKYQQKMFSNRGNIVPYKEIGVMELNGDVRILSGSSYIAASAAIYENMAKIALNAVRLPKFEPVNGISWSPRKNGKRFTATFRARVILRTRRELRGL